MKNISANITSKIIKLYLIEIFLYGVAVNDAMYSDLVKQVARNAKISGMKRITEILGAYDMVTSGCYKDILKSMYPKLSIAGRQEKLLHLL